MQTSGKSQKKIHCSKGFSLVELMTVVAIIGIMSTVSLIYYSNSKQLYKTEDQGLQIIDLMQEARQKALTQRTTMRVEIDLDDNLARLINENSGTVSSDDKVIRTVPFYNKSEVRVDTRPNNVSGTPPEIAPVPAAVFKPSSYIFSPAHSVCTLRFQLNGTVVDGGTNDVGANANPVSTTIYIWKPKDGAPTNADMTKAITIVGSSGAMRMWEYTQLNGNYVWKDSRRTGY